MGCAKTLQQPVLIYPTLSLSLSLFLSLSLYLSLSPSFLYISRYLTHAQPRAPIYLFICLSILYLDCENYRMQ